MKFVAQLAHQHIIQCYGVDRDSSYLYIITDYAEGGNLKQAAPGLNWEDKKRIIIEVALGLVYLHSHDIIHRDIKGGNILLTKKNEVKLCDFGIAKITASATCACSVGRHQITESKGTPGYMAPELRGSTTPAYSFKTDIYALGKVMQDLVRGSEIPPDYMAVMESCLDNDPKKRPSAKKIVEAFCGVHWFQEMNNKGDERCDTPDDKVKTTRILSADEEFYMACNVFSGVNADVDHAGAVELFMRSARKGHTRAQIALSYCYRHGIGILSDPAEAVNWLQAAADQGSAPAQTALGRIYLNGSMGVRQDFGRALDLLQAAASQGHIGACTSLAEVNLTGTGVHSDETEAMRWFRKAAEGGDAFAQARMGQIYYFGRGVEKDYAKSMNFLLMAASQEQTMAYLLLADMYRFGRGVSQDDEKAVDWWLKAAERGDMNAQYNVGVRLVKGIGVEKNTINGRNWLAKAKLQGHEMARCLLKAIDQEIKRTF
ncbi:uncharacterized protein EMPS_09847 [Entomortierella parvispora]|uniref:Protein kinase domain-containing protein n=1 Tax=Entomortierella parvispora TaxID=205924 RepID=A0A9P3HJ54_9FUNG|nr:uncharacterized protein EMPS_09847 [Entomortierella parvispora]